MNKVNPSKVEQDWRARGFKGGHWTDPPGQRWEDYVHDTDELLMLLQGELELEMNGRKIYPRLGEEIFIPANTVHSVRNIGRTESRWLYAYKTGDRS